MLTPLFVHLKADKAVGREEESDGCFFKGKTSADMSSHHSKAARKGEDSTCKFNEVKFISQRAAPCVCAHGRVLHPRFPAAAVR